eukprot:gene16839-biopygen5295
MPAPRPRHARATPAPLVPDSLRHARATPASVSCSPRHFLGEKTKADADGRRLTRAAPPPGTTNMLQPLPTGWLTNCARFSCALHRCGEFKVDAPVRRRRRPRGDFWETADDNASGTRPFLQILSCGTRPWPFLPLLRAEEGQLGGRQPRLGPE